MRASRQAAENAAFLDALRRTGNSSLAARLCGLNRSTLRGRRRRSAVFAARWEAASLASHAALKLGGGDRPAENPGASAGLRTEGGEIMVGRTRGGRLQLRRAPPGRMTEAGEHFFFRALAASANVRLSAAATGFTHSAFYQKRKKRPAFASEMKLALTIGFDRLEAAAIERTLQALAGGGPETAWLGAAIAGNPLPPFTFDQAFQILCLHRDTVRLDGARPPGRPARVEPNLPAALFAIGRNIDAIERAAHYEATGSWRHAREAPPPRLPPLDLVTGWSKADPAKVKHNPDLALFGGWRIEDWHKRRRKG
ncbi:MAG TPA: hypothetical protein VFZ91_04770 [Allosphingosinicella sp.]